MDQIIINFISELQLGEMQSWKNMAIVPLFIPFSGGLDYITLKEALAQKLITITEIDASGSISEIKAINRSSQYVLLLDGEELVGAKQNRVLNSSILLPSQSTTKLPVSCSEQGRWDYTTTQFSDSDILMYPQARRSQNLSVTHFLQERDKYASDQGQAWSDIAEMHRITQTFSTTGAMRDAYVAKSEALETYAQNFSPISHQHGSLFFIDGKLLGFDFVSQETAYQVLHPKLIKSYALESLLQQRSSEKDFSPAQAQTQASEFLQTLQTCQTTHFEGVGLGQDYRFEGEEVIGSALIYENQVIHSTFYKRQINQNSSKHLI